MTLNTAPQTQDPDGLYSALIAMHAGLTDAESHRLNARLILLLINHIGEADVIRAAIALARKTHD